MTDNQKSKDSDRLNPPLAVQPSIFNDELVSAEKLIELLWDKDSRPSLRWLRQQQAEGTIPFVKIGRRVWFDPKEVRRCLVNEWASGTRARRKRLS